MKMEKAQALALAQKHPSFAQAKLVLVDEHGNMRFNPDPSQYDAMAEGGETEVFVVKGNIEEIIEPPHKED